MFPWRVHSTASPASWLPPWPINSELSAFPRTRSSAFSGASRSSSWERGPLVLVLCGFPSYTAIYEKQGAVGILDVPMQWKGTHSFQVAGGIFLTVGAVIFTIMDIQAMRAVSTKDALLEDGVKASA